MIIYEWKVFWRKMDRGEGINKIFLLANSKLTVEISNDRSLGSVSEIHKWI